MQRSLYEMDIENSIALAKEQGLSQGKDEERVAMVRGLLDIGQQHDQIIKFLVKTRNLTTKQAESYYQAAKK